MRFVYRQSPRPLVTIYPVSDSDPPENVSGMITVTLDAGGRLLYLSVVPKQLEGTISATNTDWTPLFTESGVDMKAFKAATPRWSPLNFCDARAAWDGSVGANSVHLTAAAHNGKPVYFRIVWPWTSPERSNKEPPEAGNRIRNIMLALLVPTLFTFCIIVARKHVRMGRGDRKGAARVAAAYFVSESLFYAPVAHYAGDAGSFLEKLFHGAGVALFFASFIYVSYLTIEPYFRRRWSHLLISLQRTLSGRFSDPRVGRDVFASCLIGVLMSSVFLLPYALGVTHIPEEQGVRFHFIRGLAGIGGFASIAGDAMGGGIFWALMLAVVLTIGRVLLRRNWLAWLLVAVLGLPMTLTGPNPLLDVPAGVLYLALGLFTADRFGILGFGVAGFVSFLVSLCNLTLDFSRWYVWSSVGALAIVAAIAIHGFRAALAGRPLFGKPILED